jgi:uncharacterized membrane protein YesL
VRRRFLNRFIPAVAHHLVLGLLRLVGCLPVVTAPAATAALFEVTRQRLRDEDPPLVRAFASAARQYARPALTIGLGWAAVGALIAADLLIAVQIDVPAGNAVVVGLLVLSILYTLVSTALFPVLVSFDAQPRSLPRNAVLLRTAALVALLSPVRGLLALAATATAAAAIWTVPLAIVIIPSLHATAVSRLYRGAFERLRSVQRPHRVLTS